jgi:hypothetical protein
MEFKNQAMLADQYIAKREKNTRVDGDNRSLICWKC